MKHWIAAGLAFAMFGAALPARAEDDHVILALPTEGLQFLAYYVAEDLGIFTQQQLEVKHIVLPGVASFNAVVSNSAEFAFGSGASITRAAARGQRMLAIAQINNRPSWDIVIRKDVADAAHFDPNASIEVRAKVLQGKDHWHPGHQFARPCLSACGGARLGGDADNMTVTAMAPVDTLAAFARHAIDGFVSGPPWPEQVEDDGSSRRHGRHWPEGRTAELGSDCQRPDDHPAAILHRPSADLREDGSFDGRRGQSRA